VHFQRRSNSQEIVKAQESRAANFLRAKGLKLLCRNYHSRFDEIDLILSDSGTLVFIEVRYRANGLFGGAVASVTVAKQRRIRLTAAHYLQTHNGLQHCPCRFDVLGLSGEADANSQTGAQCFDWIKNAFSKNLHTYFEVLIGAS
jgi:putative endonuclease